MTESCQGLEEEVATATNFPRVDGLRNREWAYHCKKAGAVQLVADPLFFHFQCQGQGRYDST